MELGFAGNTFIIAGTICLACATIIKRPIAVTIAMSIFAIAADSDTMRKCGDEWKTKKNGGQTTELDELAKSMLALLTSLEGDAHWDDGVFKTVFKPQADQFVEEAGKCGTYRDGVGDTLHSSADLYDNLRKLVVLVTVAMVGWAIAVGAGKATPGTWFGVQLVVNEGLKKLWAETIRPVLGKLMIHAFAVGGIYQGVSMLSMQQQIKFQEMQARLPMFDGLALGNDKTTGALTPKSIGLDTNSMPAGTQAPGSTAET
ncbi:hypothetical protein ABZ297_09015 [Nonomuraea sp. NPDC005983]|uniref:hypothetical protein n=1 Tax=Nonomuraea sp. NPDC005983 TaxID=3155595 RepID=UPI0033A15E8D